MRALGRRTNFLAVAAALSLALGACGAEDTAAPAGEEAVEEEKLKASLGHGDFFWPEAEEGDIGGGVYADICASCHDEGLGRAPHRSMLGLMSPDSIYAALTTGTMQVNAEGLSDEQMVAVSEFITQTKLGGITADPIPQCTGTAAEFDVNEPPVWPGWGLDLENTRMVSNEAAGITKQNVGKLKLKWALAYPDAIRARSHPMLAGGAIYVGSHNGTVFALDRETGCARWTYQAATEVRTGIVITPWEAGDASAKPTAYFADLIGNVYAVDARTGALVWRDRPEAHPNTSLTGTPVLHEGKLYVPISSLEEGVATNSYYPCCTFRGSIMAYNAADGSHVWQTYVIGEPVETGVNPAGAKMYGPSGVAIWNAPAIDVKRNRLYVATGDNYSTPATENSDAIMAFDLDDGKIAWVYQAMPNDAWNGSCSEGGDRANCPEEDGPDYDFGAAAVIVPAGDGKDLVIAGQKSGIVYAIDADTGKLVWEKKVGRGGIKGGVHFGMAADGGEGGSGLLYVPISDTPDGRPYEFPSSPGVHAVDIKSGEILWRSPAPLDTCGELEFCNPGVSIAITATPDLVISGGLDGVVRIRDTADGAIIWEYDTKAEVETVSGAPSKGGAMAGGAAPVVHDGMLIVNSGYGFSGNMPGNLLMVFEVAE